MMKRTTGMALVFCLAAALLAACGSSGGNAPSDAIEEVDVEYQFRDSTLYGICGQATTAGRMQLITDTGDTLLLSLAQAQADGKVLGAVKTGGRYGVVANSDSTVALSVINITALLGDWVTEDAIDGGDEVGITLKDGGVAESINHTTIQYKSWRLVNGLLELVNTQDDGIDYEEVALYELLRLTPDSLVFRELDGMDTPGREDVYEYTRQKPKDNSVPGVTLEESSFEDFVF